MPKGSKNVFDELERDVPFPYGQLSKHEKGVSNKGMNKSNEEIKGQGIVLKEKIRKAKSY
jgi:hypothetical protein